ncbi:MAG: hypothetical protein FWE74_07715 [Oscillospiraceae bacterium]|nr:hypothetical protein [Oscillospiraceae bacterium]
MFGFFKKKKKDLGYDGYSPPVQVPEENSVPYYREIEDSGYFLNEKDIKIIIKACVFFVKNSGTGGSSIVDKIPETGGKLRDKTDLSPDDITVISICLQAYNSEMCKLMSELPESPAVFKLRNEKTYFLSIIEKLTRYLSAA